jgi:iron complex outermembrane receptor protein
LSGSWYEYDYSTVFSPDPGIVFYGLTAPDGSPLARNDLRVEEEASNIGASLGVQYDMSDRTTLSFEGRYQVDEICGLFQETGENVCTETTAFLPRLAITNALSDSHSVYGQFSIGNSPAGVNVDFLDPVLVESLNVASGAIVSPNDGFIYDGSDGVHFPAVTYGPEAFADYTEEKLYNFEIGSKGTYADGRGSYTGAVYYMIWEGMLNRTGLNWDDSDVNGWNEDNWAATTGIGAAWQNQGDGEFYGIEAQTDFAVNDVWTVGGYATFGRAKYKEFCDPDAPLYVDSAGNNITPLLRPENGDDVDYTCGVVDGNQIPDQPKVTANLNIRATLPNDVVGMRTSFRADWRYTGSSFEDALNTLERSAVGTLNMSASMRNDHWNLRLFVNNVLDNDTPRAIDPRARDQYYADADPTVVPRQEAAWRIFPTRPREIGLQVNYNF